MMSLDPTIIETLAREFATLPDPLKAVLGKSVGVLAKVAGSAVGKGTWRKVFGEREDRAVKRALTKAVAGVIASWDAKDAENAARVLRRSPFREELILVIRNPGEEINRQRLEETFRKTKIDLGIEGLSPEKLFTEVAGRFLLHLREERDARGLYTVTRLDQIHAVQVDLREDVREVRTALDSFSTPGELPRVNWLTPAFEALYADARTDISEGRLIEAERVLRRLLETIQSQLTRDAAGASHEENARRSAEQGLRLSYAQLLVKRDDRAGAVALLEEARALQPLEGKNRLRAGWVLLNLGRSPEARTVLEPHDGTAEWRTLLGITYLEENALEEFRRIFPRDADISDADVLVALARYHSSHGALLEAEHIVRGLVSDDTNANAIWRGITAGTTLLGYYASSLDPHEVNAEQLISRLRRLHQRADDPAVRLSAPQLRAVLWMRVVFYRLLLETDAMNEAFHALAAVAPADAASAAGWMPPEESRADEILRIAPVAESLVETALAEAGSLVARGNDAEAADRLSRVRSLASGVDLDRLLAFELEARADAGEDVAALAHRLDEIPDPVTREIVRSSLAVTGGRPEEGRAYANAALAEYPNSLRLIRVAFAHTRDAAAEAAQRGTNARDLRLGAVHLAERLVRRLPCPEHRLVLVRARALAGDLDGAYDELQKVSQSGYVTKATAELSIDLARRKRYVREYAHAAGEYYASLDSSPDVGFTAAEAVALAGDRTRAQAILRALTTHEDRRVAVRAYHALARLISHEAPENPEAPEQAVEVLLEGYERLDRPQELVAPLLRQGFGTRLAAAVGERLQLDFGSIASLPGFRSVSEEQFVQLHWQRLQRAEAMAELLRVGAVPLQTYAISVGRELSLEWYSRRHNRTPLLIAPPLFPDDDEPPAGLPHPLLVDRTALLAMVETGTLDLVLSSELKLVLGRDTFDWLFHESASLRESVDISRRTKAQELLAFIELHPGVRVIPSGEVDRIEELAAALPLDLAHAIAVARSTGASYADDGIELEDVPTAFRNHVYSSDDLLTALFQAGKISFTEAASAAQRVPKTFSGNPSPRPAKLEQPILLGQNLLAEWHEAGLLEKLADAVTQLLIDVETVASLHKTAADALTRDEAIRAVDLLQLRLMDAVESQRIELYPPEIPTDLGTDDTAPVLNEQSRTRIDKQTESVERAYRLATGAGTWVWSDDAATHLYLNSGGVLIANEPDFTRRSQVLRQRYPSMKVIGTPVVLAWLVQMGKLSQAQHTNILADLVSHRRLLMFDREVLSGAAVGVGSEKPHVSESAAAVLAAFAETPTDVPDRVLMRMIPRVAASICDALDCVWFEHPELSPETRSAAVATLLDAFIPWIADRHPFGRLAASAAWSFLTSRLFGRLDSDPASLVRNVLEYASHRPTEFAFLLGTTVRMLDITVQAMDDLGDEMRLLPVLLYKAISGVVTTFRQEGRPLVPFEVLRLSGQAVGLDPSFRVHATVDSDAGPLPVTYTTRELEQEAARSVEVQLEEGSLQDEEEDVTAYLGLRVQFEARVIGGTDKTIPVQAAVDSIHVLPRLGSAGRAYLLRAYQAYHERIGATDVTRIVESHFSAITANVDVEAEHALEAFYRDLLLIPRTWLELDAIRFFEVLRDAPYDTLRDMVGQPEYWRSGESLFDRVSRLAVARTRLEDVLPLVHSLWGPFQIAVRQLEDFSLLHAREQPAPTDVRRMLDEAAEIADPYVQIFRIGMVTADLILHPELRSFSPSEGEATLEDLVRQRILKWVRAGLIGYEPAIKLHDLVARLVFAAVFDPSHVRQAVDFAGSAEDGDPLGDLLLLGHLLLQHVFNEVLSRSEELGIELLLTDLERVSSQYPLAMSASPAAEIFVPDLLGTTDYRTDPYLTTLMALLETNTLLGMPRSRVDEHPSSMVEEMDLASRVPFWWSPELEAEMHVLAARELSPAGLHLHKIAQEGESANRFGLLVAEPAEVRARRLLNRFGCTTDQPLGGESVESLQKQR
jgi:hypothetical protein